MAGYDSGVARPPVNVEAEEMAREELAKILGRFHPVPHPPTARDIIFTPDPTLSSILAELKAIRELLEKLADPFATERLSLIGKEQR